MQLRVRYPLDGVVPPSVALADGAPVHFEQAAPGDLLRLLPTCELGCGTDADSTAGQYFPFQALPLPRAVRRGPWPKAGGMHRVRIHLPGPAWGDRQSEPA